MDDTERLVVLLEARVRDFERNMQKASGTAGREFGQMRKDSRSATAAMEADMVRTTGRINQALASVSTKVGAMGAAFGPATAAVGVAVGALAGFAVQAREVASEMAAIGDEAKRAGVGVKAFQELKFVADQNRVSIDALTDGLKEMNLRADEFIVTGSGSGADAFKRLGFTATELAKKLKDPSALFTEIIGKLEGLDRAAQIRIADEVFGGTGGEEFVQLIDQGAAGIRRTIDEANRLGIVMDEQMIAKAAEVDRQFKIISQTVGTTLKTAIVNAASALADFLDGFRAFENQQNGSLDAQVTALGQKRLDIETKILTIRGEQGKLSDVAKDLGFTESADPRIAQLEAESAALGEQEQQILAILKARGAFNMSSKETADGLRDVGKGGAAAADSLDYVTRNGGSATTTVDRYGKSVDDLRTRLTGSVSALQLQIDTFGQSEGAIAAARFEADAMADALRAANAAGRDSVDPATISFIKSQAAEYGALTQQIGASTEAEQTRQRVVEEAAQRRQRITDFSSDLAFERSILSLPDAEQDVRQTLRDLGVDFDSYEGQRLAASMRFNDSIRDQQDAMRDAGDMAADVFGDMIDSLGRGGDLVDALAQSLAGIGKQLETAGLNRLFGNLLGTGSQSGGFATVLAGLNGRVAANTNIPTPTARPSYTTTDVATVSGSMMSYASRFNSSVDSRLLKILNTAAGQFDLKVDAVSGLRPGDKRFHGQGVATDVQIYGANGQALGNYQDASTFRTYERFAQIAKKVQSDLFPELEGMLRWGGYFSGGKGKYGAVDNMHFDLAGKKVGMGGGSWENGLTDAQRRLWTGAESIGMSKSEFQRTLTAGTSKGVETGLTEYGRSSSGGPQTGSAQPMTQGQAGLGALAGFAGIAGNGYASGSPIAGGFSGALGGLELGGTLATAFPSLGAAAGPLGAPVGRAAPLFRKKEKVA